MTRGGRAPDGQVVRRIGDQVPVHLPHPVAGTPSIATRGSTFVGEDGSAVSPEPRMVNGCPSWMMVGNTPEIVGCVRVTAFLPT